MAKGQRIQLTDATFNTTRWLYDAQGQVLAETDPNRLSIVNEYDANGNLTRRTTLVSGAPTGAYVQYSWDHRNQLTKVEFYNAPVNGTATLAKTVAYTYDDSSNRINKTLTVPGQAPVVEHYVYDGDQLAAVLNATGAIQHEYLSGSSLDQVFADQTALSDVLWRM